MSRNPQLLRERNRLIKEAYNKYAQEHVVGPKGEKYEKYKHTAILAMVAKKFFLEPTTIGNIMSQPDQDDISPNQLELFTEK